MSPISEEFTGKTWTKTFTRDSQTFMLMTTISYTEAYFDNVTPVKGMLKIYLGDKVVKPQSITFDRNTPYVQLVYAATN